MKIHILKGGRTKVTQVDLENMLAYDAQIARAQEQRDRLAASILSRINEGADIEDGARSYDIEESYQGKRRVQKLIVR